MSMREIKIKPLLRKRAMRVVIGLSLMIGLGGALLLLTIPNPLFSNIFVRLPIRNLSYWLRLVSRLLMLKG